MCKFYPRIFKKYYNYIYIKLFRTRYVLTQNKFIWKIKKDQAIDPTLKMGDDKRYSLNIRLVINIVYGGKTSNRFL